MTTQRAYYNEFDPKAAAWLRELIAKGHISPGDVDSRSIEDVTPSDLAGYTQCHFFAGIGGWSYALRLAGWADARPVWTGSCPCQPFSAAGKGGGFDDERHLWPAWFHLIRECRPGVVFGEQVSSKDGLGWLDIVSDDLQGEGYAVGAADFSAAFVGAPHIRQRLYFVGHTDVPRSQGWGQRGNGADQRAIGASGVALSVAHAERGAAERHGFKLADAAGAVQGTHGQRGQAPSERNDNDGAASERQQNQHGAGVASSHWSNAQWLECIDGKARPIEPGSFPLAHGIPGRVGLLRGYGNAIVPAQAQMFIESVADGLP